MDGNSTNNKPSSQQTLKFPNNKRLSQQKNI
jgi:hypothetical protein